MNCLVEPNCDCEPKFYCYCSNIYICESHLGRHVSFQGKHYYYPLIKSLEQEALTIKLKSWIKSLDNLKFEIFKGTKELIKIIENSYTKRVAKIIELTNKCFSTLLQIEENQINSEIEIELQSEIKKIVVDVQILGEKILEFDRGFFESRLNSNQPNHFPEPEETLPKHQITLKNEVNLTILESKDHSLPEIVHSNKNHSLPEIVHSNDLSLPEVADSNDHILPELAHFNVKNCSYCGKGFCLACFKSKFPKKTCEHIICNECNDSSKNTQSQCIKCCEVCKGSNCNKTKLKCNHFKCENAKQNSSCNVCNQYHICYECFKRTFNKCSHGLCDKCCTNRKCCDNGTCEHCKSNVKISRSNVCLHKCCFNCKTINNCSLTCQNCQKQDKTICTHGYCQSCETFCFGCYCQQCKNKRKKDIASCNHLVCSKCFVNGCLFCKENTCHHLLILPDSENPQNFPEEIQNHLEIDDFEENISKGREKSYSLVPQKLMEKDHDLCDSPKSDKALNSFEELKFETSFKDSLEKGSDDLEKCEIFVLAKEVDHESEEKKKEDNEEKKKEDNEEKKKEVDHKSEEKKKEDNEEKKKEVDHESEEKKKEDNEEKKMEVDHESEEKKKEDNEEKQKEDNEEKQKEDNEEKKKEDNEEKKKEDNEEKKKEDNEENKKEDNEEKKKEDNEEKVDLIGSSQNSEDDADPDGKELQEKEDL